MRILWFLFSIVLAVQAQSQELIVGTLNTESASDTQPFKVAETIRGVGFVDVWAFQEVADVNAATEFLVAAGSAPGRKSFRMVVSESGENAQPHRRNDLLAIAYNSSRLRQVETVELHGIRSVPGPTGGRLGDAEWRLRGALFLRLQDRVTGVEFYVGNVHLKCCDGDGLTTRAHQAQIIRDWVDRSDVPVILTGDFNIPVSPNSANGAQSSDAFTKLEEVLVWHRPTNPIKTQCSPNFNSMLDHFFLKGGPNLDMIDVEIQETDQAYCDADSAGGADHRPVVARLSITP